MARLPVVSGRELIAALRRLGYQVTRTKGSHVRLVCEGSPSVTVPLHDELDRGTLSAILSEAGISADRLLELLGRRPRG
jgi:predicted RNA binding protein YcfA (HicA-like mRNA interferase family)